MKEIVIKIDDEFYEKLMDRTKYMHIHSLCALADAVRKGTELPKGHGELIDARAFLQSINNNDYDTYNDYSNTVDWIEDAETLVEADKQ